MKIAVGKIGNYTEIILSGRLDNDTSIELESIIGAEVKNGNSDLLVNFSELTYINSSALRVFLAIAKSLAANDKKLNFCEMQDYIKEVFNIAGFNNIFTFYSTREEAVINLCC